MRRLAPCLATLNHCDFLHRSPTLTTCSSLNISSVTTKTIPFVQIAQLSLRCELLRLLRHRVDAVSLGNSGVCLARRKRSSRRLAPTRVDESGRSSHQIFINSPKPQAGSASLTAYRSLSLACQTLGQAACGPLRLTTP